MLRSLFISLSANDAVRSFVIGFPLARRVSRRFVAGERLDEAVAAIRRLNQRGLLATFDHLGENVRSAAEAREAAGEYIRMLDAIEQGPLQSNISLKLTHMGLDLGMDVCLENLRRILTRAKQSGIVVRIDMEGSPYTQRTLDTYDQLRREGFDDIGVVIQAYLYRSEGDIRRLAAQGARIRICKGAYQEPAEIAYPQKHDVDENYKKLATIMWEPEALATGAVAALATHDENIIQWGIDETNRRGIHKHQFEFQMLYGIRRERQEQLARSGYRFRVYVPYGAQWYPYFMRRLAERPANALFLLRSLFER
jgi:proline dehydrogenase